MFSGHQAATQSWSYIIAQSMAEVLIAEQHTDREAGEPVIQVFADDSAPKTTTG